MSLWHKRKGIFGLTKKLNNDHEIVKMAVKLHVMYTVVNVQDMITLCSTAS